MLTTAVAKKRLVGVLLLAIILTLFFSFNRFPKLDIVGEDLDAITAPERQCFQGFCIEREAGVSFLSKWTSFSVTYLRLVTVGMTFAFLVAGLAEAFLFPKQSGTSFQSGGIFKRTIRGAAVGPVMNLCSACIVPVSSAFHRRAGLAGAIAMVQGSATMNIPALAMVFFVFTPLLGISRLLLAVIGALLIGPIVVMTVRKEREPTLEIPTLAPEEESDWKTVLNTGFRGWAKASIGYLVRMAPIMVIAGFASGLVIQWLSPETVAAYLGNDVRGVVIAATFGILINVPLLFEIPLVALLLLMGMGTAPAAALLFAAAAGGPVTFWGLAKLMPKRAIATFAAATWGLGAFGGLAVLGIGVFAWGQGSEPTISAPPPARRAARDAQFMPRSTAVLPKAAPTVAPMANNIRFVDVAETSGVAFKHQRHDYLIPLGGGAAVGDFDGDGSLDIYVTNSAGPNALYLNNGDGTYSDMAGAAGVDDPEGTGNGAAAGDYDNDGDLDLFVANFHDGYSGTSKLFQNNGSGTFTDVTAKAGVGDPDETYRTTGATWGDFDLDGFLDLLVVRHLGEQEFGVLRTYEFAAAARPLALYRNNRDGTFSNVTHRLGNVDIPRTGVMGAGFKPSFVDYDNDGDPDIYVVNDFGEQNQPNVLWRNDGDGRFTDVSIASGTDLAIAGMGLGVGDYDNDGDFDFYVSNLGPSIFLEQQGDRQFTDVTGRTGTGRGVIAGNYGARDASGLALNNPAQDASVGWGTLFADFNNNGLLDLYLVAGHLDSDAQMNLWYQPNALFQNLGDGAYADVSTQSGADDPGIGREVVAADFNSDGLLDLFIVNMGDLKGTPGTARLLQNASTDTGNWLALDLTGTASNRDGLGARITVTADGITRIREMGASQGHQSQSVVPVHFGLGDSIEAESIVITWPSGTVQTLERVAANQTLTVTEP